MSNEFIIIKKDVLPDYFANVLKVKEELANGKFDNVSQACQKYNISRSTYYKYKDSIYDYSNESAKRQATLSLTLSHKAGALSTVCKVLSEDNISIMTISQSLPIQDKASVLVSIDISNMDYAVKTLLSKLSSLDAVVSVELLAIE